MRRKSYNGTIALAYFHRFFLVLTLPSFVTSVLIFGYNPVPAVISMAVPVFLYSIYSVVGCIFKWSHIYCSYQHAAKQKMTPTYIRWNDMPFSEKYGVPMFLGIVSLMMVLAVIIWPEFFNSI